MDLIIVLLLGVIAAAMFTGKPLNINFKVTQELPPVEIEETVQEKEEEEQLRQSMNSVIQTVNDFMGVDSDDEERQR